MPELREDGSPHRADILILSYSYLNHKIEDKNKRLKIDLIEVVEGIGLLGLCLHRAVEGHTIGSCQQLMSELERAVSIDPIDL